VASDRRVSVYLLIDRLVQIGFLSTTQSKFKTNNKPVKITEHQGTTQRTYRMILTKEEDKKILWGSL
jgi:hypothetical protein